MKTLYDDQPKVPKYNIVENNISIAGTFIGLYDGVDFDLATIRNNVIADPVSVRMTMNSDQTPNFTIYKNGRDETMQILEGNTVLLVSFKPYEMRNGRIQLDLTAIPKEIGFQPIPFEEIGLKR